MRLLQSITLMLPVRRAELEKVQVQAQVTGYRGAARREMNSRAPLVRCRTYSETNARLLLCNSVRVDGASTQVLSILHIVAHILILDMISISSIQPTGGPGVQLTSESAYSVISAVAKLLDYPEAGGGLGRRPYNRINSQFKKIVFGKSPFQSLTAPVVCAPYFGKD